MLKTFINDRFPVAILFVITIGNSHALSFDDIDFWVGSGNNQAAFDSRRR